MTERQLPSAIPSESGLLGAALVDSKKVMAMAIHKGVTPAHFHEPDYSVLWTCFTWLHEQGRWIDLATAKAALEKGKTTRGRFPLSFLTGLVDSAPIPTMLPTLVDGYIEDILQAHLARRVIAEMNATAGRIHDGECVEDVLARHLQAVHDMTRASTGQQRTGHEQWAAVREKAEQIRDGRLVAIPTPWPTFNEFAGGLWRRVVSLVIGRSKTGKSYLAQQFGLYASMQHEAKTPGAYYSLEDDEEIAFMRAACQRAGINAFDFLRGRFSDDDMKRVNEQAEIIADSSYTILRGKGKRLEQLRMDIAQGVAESGWQYVIFDAFKDVGETYGDNKKEAALATWLHDIAIEFDLAVLVMQHVKQNRTGNRPAKDPWWEKLIKEDSRGATQITDSARLILALQCQYINVAQGGKGFQNYVMDCVANNYGGIGAVSLDVDPVTREFIEAPNRIPFSDWEDANGKKIMKLTPWREIPPQKSDDDDHFYVEGDPL